MPRKTSGAKERVGDHELAAMAALYDVLHADLLAANSILGEHEELFGGALRRRHGDTPVVIGSRLYCAEQIGGTTLVVSKPCVVHDSSVDGSGGAR